jgi:hypothetical protein
VSLLHQLRLSTLVEKLSTIYPKLVSHLLEYKLPILASLALLCLLNRLLLSRSIFNDALDCML